MSKKKIIIALVIFIFLGLTIFTFANPAEDENQNLDGNNDNNNIEEVNKDNNDANGSNNNIANSDNKNNIVQPVGSIDNDSYDAALKAVVSAEEKIENNSYNEALALVDKVTNEEQKSELNKRLDEVKKGIDVKALVETLETKTTSASNKIDITDARNYRTDEKIESLVASLTNETLKNALQSKIVVLSKLLDDTTNPIVNIEDEAMLSKNTTIIVEDDNEVIIKLSKNNEENVEIENNTEVTEGSYTLTVIDSAFNEITISFTIDATAPVIFGVENNKVYKEATIKVTDEYLESVVVNELDEEELLTSSKLFNIEGTYTVIAKDEAGNSTTVTFTIDRTKPVITGVTDGSYYNYDVTPIITDNNLKNATLKFNGSHIKSYKVGDTLTEEGTYTLVATDLAMNKSTLITFVIDKTAPEIKLFDDRNNVLQDGGITKKEVKAIITDNSGSYTAILTDQNGNSREYESGTFVGRGNWTLIVKDASENTTTVTFKVDKDYPLVYLNGTKNEKVNTIVKYFNKDITLKVSDLNLDTVVLTKDENEISYNNEMVLTEEGKYVVTATDEINNKTQVTFVIDKTNPVLLLKDDTIGTEPYFTQISFKLHDNNAVDYYVLNGTKVDVSNSSWGDANYNNVKSLLNVGKNTIELYDIAGNKTEQVFYYKYLISNFEELQEAFATGGEVKLVGDIAVSTQLVLPKGNNLKLDMNGKKITLSKDVELSTIDPMMDIKSGSKITITGNGTFDLEDNYSASLMYPRGDVIIENGNFLRDAGGTGYGSYFVGISGGKGKLIIYDGYFDGGSYKANSNEFDNSRDLLNASWGQYIRVYGGTFVGQNPAYGDEGMAFTNPNRVQTNYCQGLFFEGQKREDTEIPEEYTVIVGTHSDGRPTYTVVYTGDI